MMALLYETVPAFEDTWIECLGDLSCYRMAIRDDDIRDRDVWTRIARHWDSKASNKAPTSGRLYQHLATFARPKSLMSSEIAYSTGYAPATPDKRKDLVLEHTPAHITAVHSGPRPQQSGNDTGMKRIAILQHWSAVG
jgi:hypothetical protein